MNLMRIFLVFMTINLFYYVGLIANVVIEPVDQNLSQVMEAEKRVFKKSFSETYKKIPEILKSISDLDVFLVNAFSLMKSRIFL